MSVEDIAWSYTFYKKAKEKDISTNLLLVWRRTKMPRIRDLD